MNDADLEKNIEKTFKILDVSARIHEYAYNLAVDIVDRNMPYKEEIKRAPLPSQRLEIAMNREQAIGAVVANILTLADGVIV